MTTRVDTQAESRLLQKSAGPLITVLLLSGPILMLAFVLQIL